MSYTTNNGTSWTPSTNNNSIGYSDGASFNSNVTANTLTGVAIVNISTCGTYVVSMNAQFPNSPNAWIWVCGNSSDTILNTMSW